MRKSLVPTIRQPRSSGGIWNRWVDALSEFELASASKSHCRLGKTDLILRHVPIATDSIGRASVVEYAMRQYQDYAKAIPVIALVLAIVALLLTLVAEFMRPASMGLLSSVLSSLCSLAIACAAIVGLRSWKRQAGRQLAQQFMRQMLILQNRVRDADLEGSAATKALSALIGAKGLLVDPPWNTRERVLDRVVNGLQEKRDAFLSAKLDFEVALAEVQASGWTEVADDGDQAVAIAELVNLQLVALRSMAHVWRDVERVAEPERQKASLGDRDKAFDETAARFRMVVEAEKRILATYLSL